MSDLIYLYAGDEIEVSSNGLTYESRKSLHCLSYPQVSRPTKLIIVVTLRTNNPSIPAKLGILIDNDEEPRAEVTSREAGWEIKIMEIDCASWVKPRLHSIDLLLKTTKAGGIAYNNLFEIYYVVGRR